MTDLAKLEASLSKAMRAALLADRSRGECAYSMRVSIGTLDALKVRGLVTRKAGFGSMFSPRTDIDWPLTPLGLALQAHIKETSC